ncbi:MAG: P-loop NTPase [Chloroflexota bacterium]
MYQGKIILIYSPKGGTGSTTITANLAVALHSEKNPVVVVDGRLHYGDVSFFFNEQARNNVSDLTSRADELDPEIIEDVLVNHGDTGIKILAAPPRPEQAEGIRGEQFSKVLKYLANNFAYVIVDTSSGLDDVTLNAIESADIINLVVTQDIPAIKNARLFLNLVDAFGMDRKNIVVTLNMFDKRKNVTPERIADITKQPVIASIPSDEKLVSPAMDKGEPFIAKNKNHPVSKALLQMAKEIVEKIKEIENTAIEQLN